MLRRRVGPVTGAMTAVRPGDDDDAELTAVVTGIVRMAWKRSCSTGNGLSGSHGSADGLEFTRTAPWKRSGGTFPGWTENLKAGRRCSSTWTVKAAQSPHRPCLRRRGSCPSRRNVAQTDAAIRPPLPAWAAMNSHLAERRRSYNGGRAADQLCRDVKAASATAEPGRNWCFDRHCPRTPNSRKNSLETTPTRRRQMADV